MSQEDVEKFRNALEAFNRGDVEGALKDMDPKVEWQTPQSLPDAQTYYGHEGVKAWWAMWSDAFADLRLEPAVQRPWRRTRAGSRPSIGQRSGERD